MNAILLLGTLLLVQQDRIEWQKNYEDAIVRGRQTATPVLLYVYDS